MHTPVSHPRIINNQAAYLAMLRKAKEIGWPEHYKKDLTEHDRNRVGAFADGLVFVWLVRSTGTWLIIPPWASGQAKRDWGQHGDGSILRYCRRYEPHRAFLWDGTSLQEVTLAEAENKLMTLAPDSWVH